MCATMSKWIEKKTRLHDIIWLQLITQLSPNNGSLFVPIGNGEGPCNNTCFTRLRNGTVVEESRKGVIHYQEIVDKDWQMKEWYRDLLTTIVESDEDDYRNPYESYMSAVPSNETFEVYDVTNKWSTMWFTEAPATRQSYVYPVPDHQQVPLKYESHPENWKVYQKNVLSPIPH